LAELLKPLGDDVHRSVEENTRFATRLHQIVFLVYLQRHSSDSADPNFSLTKDLLQLAGDYSAKEVIAHQPGAVPLIRIECSAIFMRLLHQLARYLSSDSSKQPSKLLAELPSKDVDVCKVVAAVMNGARRADSWTPVASPEIELLRSLRDQNAIMALLEDVNALTMLGMTETKWRIPAAKDRTLLPPCYPFQLATSKNNALKIIYDEIVAALRAGDPMRLQNILGPQHNPRCSVLDGRFCLLLALYYEFFNLNRPVAAAIKNSMVDGSTLANAYEMSPMLLKCFRFFLDGYANIDSSDSGTDLLPLLGKRRGERNLEVCHVMVNLLAFIVGTPQSAHPFYIRAFEPERMGQLAPGSASEGRQNWDCYFQVEANSTICCSYDIISFLCLVRP